MEVECVKYHERINSEEAECRHPADYCKYRTSCIIHFLGDERKREDGAAGAQADEPVEKVKQASRG